MPEFLGFAKSNVIATARLAWNNSKLTEFNYTGFEDDWYPAVWMIFFLCGLPAGKYRYLRIFHIKHHFHFSTNFTVGSNSVAAFDPEKRGKRSINDHLESVRNLALSRDGRREATRCVGLADSAAKRGANFTTPVTNTSLINVSDSLLSFTIRHESLIYQNALSGHTAHCTTTNGHTRVREIHNLLHYIRS